MIANKNLNLVNTAVHFALYLIAGRLLMDILFKLLDVSAIVYYSQYCIGFSIEIVVITLAIKYFKHNNNKGLLSFGEGIQIGLIIMALTGISLFIEIYLFLPGFHNIKAIEITEKFNPEQLEATIFKIEQAKENPNYGVAFPMYVLYFCFLGFIISVIPTVVMAAKENQ